MKSQGQPKADDQFHALMEAIAAHRNLHQLMIHVSAQRRLLDELKAAHEVLKQECDLCGPLKTACARWHVPESYAASCIHRLARLLGVAPEVEDYYEILQVPLEATPQEIKQAFRRLSKIWHPDQNPDKDEATETFLRIQTAYRVLSDPVSREKYDRQRRLGELSGSEAPAPESMEARPKRPFSKLRGRRWAWIGLAAGVLATVFAMDFQDLLSRRYFALKAPPGSAVRPTPSPTGRGATAPGRAKEVPKTAAFAPPTHSQRSTAESETASTPKRASTATESNPSTDMPASASSPTLHLSFREDNPQGFRPSTTAPKETLRAASTKPTAQGGDTVSSVENGTKSTKAGAIKGGRPLEATTAARAPSPNAASKKTRTAKGSQADFATSAPSSAAPTFETKELEKPHESSPPAEPTPKGNVQKTAPSATPSAAFKSETKGFEKPHASSPSAEPTPQGSLQTVEVTESRIASFLQSYCRAFSEKRLEAFMAFFTPHATENGQPLQNLRKQYEKNFSNTKSLTYNIRLTRWRLLEKSLHLTGLFDIQAVFLDGSAVHSQGEVTLVLVPKDDTYQVQSYDYRFTGSESRPASSAAPL